LGSSYLLGECVGHNGGQGQGEGEIGIWTHLENILVINLFTKMMNVSSVTNNNGNINDNDIVTVGMCPSDITNHDMTARIISVLGEIKTVFMYMVIKLERLSVPNLI
jgi:hypothetical protein